MADTELNMGGKEFARSRLSRLAAGLGGDEIAIAVVGAHLSAWRSIANEGARRSPAGRPQQPRRTTALCASHHAAKPGMLRVEKGAGSSDRAGALGAVGGSVRKFVAADSRPAVDRTVRLADGRGVRVLSSNPDSTDARDISAFGGWRASVAEKRL